MATLVTNRTGERAGYKLASHSVEKEHKGHASLVDSRSTEASLSKKSSTDGKVYMVVSH